MEHLLAPAKLSDAEIIDRVISGEKRLFEWLIRRYNQRLYRIGMSILHEESETEEAMQVTYINAFQYLAQFEKRSSFHTWLTRIMLNQCYAQKKKNDVRQPFTEETANRAHMQTPAHILMNKELKQLLQDAIGRLPEKYRTVFILREIETLSVSDTSTILGIEESNVKVRLNRAKTMLKSQLDGCMKDNVYHFHLSKCDRMVSGVMQTLA